MTAIPPDDDLHTDGERYRTPVTPAIAHALGRAHANFSAIEGLVASLLYETGAMDMMSARQLLAGGKADALLSYTKRLSRIKPSVRPDVIEALEAAHDAFNRVRGELRNALAHAHLFTAGYDKNGRALTGVAHASLDGHERLLASEAAELHALAHDIETAIDPLSRAREAIKSL